MCRILFGFMTTSFMLLQTQPCDKNIMVCLFHWNICVILSLSLTLFLFNCTFKTLKPKENRRKKSLKIYFYSESGIVLDTLTYYARCPY